MRLYTKITQLHRVGKVLENRLRHLGIETAEDLLFYFPFRYEDYSSVVPIKELRDAMEVTIQGKIELISNKRSQRKRKVITEALIVDETGQLRVVWFGQPFIVKTLHVGDHVYLSGKVKSDMFGVQMVGPSYERVHSSEFRVHSSDTKHTARIVPMYPLTAGITQKQIRFLVSQIIDVAKEIPEWLPQEIQDQVDVMPLAEAIKAIHFPETQDELKHAEKRLKFDEIFVLQLRAEMIRQSLKRSEAPQILFKEQEIKEFVDALPYKLTNAQRAAAWEILQDIQRKEPMNRLLEGDVGSGKTVVAAMALYNTMLNGFQGVMMAPTEILAKQHFESLKDLLGQKVRIGILTRSEFSIFNFQFSNNLKKNNDKILKQNVIEEIKNGNVDIIVGTHALLTEDVHFKNLGLVIVDEQHRFGVGQRKTIKEKTENKNFTPHFLSMTATPIPRSFALTIYGDLDLSIINQMPTGRKQIITRFVDPHNREKAYGFIREQVKQGRQCFVICPLIEERVDEGQGTRNENYPTRSTLAVPRISQEKKSVLSEYEKLSKQIFPDLKVGYLHGKLKPKEKDETMNKFAKGELDILVSTSVVEVGVNIPNASVMMIEDAERFGLAQLHQFRGRVGRSVHQSYCFLFSDTDSVKAIERLQLFEKTNDGFKLAEYDLETRGPGEVYGTTQSGMMNFKLATLKDGDIIKLARDTARGIDFEKYSELKVKVEEWEKGVHLE